MQILAYSKKFFFQKIEIYKLRKATTRSFLDIPQKVTIPSSM
jgi:hypothetical protein